MENNENTNTQPQFQQPQYYYTPGYQPPIDPNYAATVKEFLTKAIVACAISSLPIGSIIAIFMATKNRQAILDYLSKGGLHTVRVKVCSCLSRAGKYAGIAYTIFWGFYLLYFGFIFLMMLLGIIGSVASR